jgi:hypothetical protein
LDPASVARCKAALSEKLRSDPAWAKKTWPGLALAGEIEKKLDELTDDVLRNESIFVNETYQVNVRRANTLDGFPPMVHLSIKRLDKQVIRDWREFQAIKNALVGKDAEAVELYPAEDRLVDTANQYHLWCLPPGQRFPFGFLERVVDYQSVAGAVQRPHEEKNDA